MHEPLLDVAERIVSMARSTEQIESFAVHRRTFQAKAYDGEIESVSSAEPRGVGVRVVLDGRTGFAYTTDLGDDGLADVVSLARDNAGYATPDDAAGLAGAIDGYDNVSGLLDEQQSRVTPEAKTDFVLELESATRNYDARIRAVEEAVYSDDETEVAIATTGGITANYAETSAWCYAIAIATDGDDTEVGFEFDLGRGIASLDSRAVARRSAESAVGVLGAEKVPSARMPIVFEPKVAAQFLGVLSSALGAEAVQRGRSLFAGRIGERVSAPLSLIDDGRISGAPGSAPWDGEGVPTQRTEVIADGVLRSFLYNTVSARREGRASTGNAARGGFKSLPRIAPTNLAFEPTGATRKEVRSEAGRALLVQDFHGVHSGANPVSGDFSVGVTGRMLEGGELGRPVKEITIARPILEILSGITTIADDRRWLPFGGSYGGATTLVDEMTVAGR
jgi:PmbA protein